MESSTKASHREPVYQLAADVVSAWRQTVWQFARLRAHAALEPIKKGGPVDGVIRREAPQIKALWSLFTTDRDDIHRYLLDPKKQAMAYLLGFHLPNLVRMQITLARLQSRYDWQSMIQDRPATSTSRFIDLGCGSGALSMGFLNFLNRRFQKVPGHIEINLFDQHGAFLDMARWGIEHLFPAVPIKAQKGKIEEKFGFIADAITSHPKDLFILGMGYVWNELAERARSKLLNLLQNPKLLDGEGLLIVLEPANEKLARTTLEFRDQLVEMGYQALYPCLHSAPCPMLNHPKDWCFSEASWDRPKELKLVDDILESNRTKVNGVFQVFATPGLAVKLKQRYQVPAATIVGRPVVKTPPAKTRTKPGPKPYEYLLCTEEAVLNKVKPTKDEPPIHRGLLWFPTDSESSPRKNERQSRKSPS